MLGVKPQRFREAIMRILDVFQGLTTQQMIQVIEKLPRRRFLEVPIILYNKTMKNARAFCKFVLSVVIFAENNQALKKLPNRSQAPLSEKFSVKTFSKGLWEFL